MFLVNSRLDLFTAPCVNRDPFSRTYGVILPSSLTTLLSLILGFSPHLPVSVYGTGEYVLHRSFSCQHEIRYFTTKISFPVAHQTFNEWICLLIILCTWPQHHLWGYPILLRHSICQTNIFGTGISTSCPSTTPFGLALGPD